MKFYQFNNSKENAIVFAENEGDAKRIYYKHFDKLDEDKLKNPEVIDIDKMYRLIMPDYRDFDDFLLVLVLFYSGEYEIVNKKGDESSWLIY
jgi:hypothetical protein